MSANSNYSLIGFRLSHYSAAIPLGVVLEFPSDCHVSMFCSSANRLTGMSGGYWKAMRGRPYGFHVEDHRSQLMTNEQLAVSINAIRSCSKQMKVSDPMQSCCKAGRARSMRFQLQFIDHGIMYSHMSANSHSSLIGFRMSHYTTAIPPTELCCNSQMTAMFPGNAFCHSLNWSVRRI